MFTVYLINEGDYDDFRICGVTSTVELAEKFMDQFPSEDWNMPMKMVVDDLMKIPKDKTLYFVRVGKLDVDKNYIMEVRPANCMYEAEMAMDNEILLDVDNNLMIRLWAEDISDAEILALELTDKYYRKNEE